MERGCGVGYKEVMKSIILKKNQPAHLDAPLYYVVVAVLFALLGFYRSSSTIAQEPKIGGQARLDSWERHQEMADRSTFKNLSWRSMGPKFAGGRIESVDAPRGDLATIYAGVGAGGIWKTVNGGLTWRPIFHRESTFAIGDLTLAPSDPNIIWVGTGECHLSSTSYAGNGVFKSVDAGATWTNMGLVESAHIGKIAVHPTNPDVVFVAAMGRMGSGGQRGVFKTSDGGKTFKRVLFKGDRVSFVEVVVDPADPERVYAASWDRSRGNGSGVFRSDDAGETWKRLEGGLLEENVDRIAIAASASQPGVVYALMADRSSPNLVKRRNASVLYRSNDAGETWNRAHKEYVPTYVGWDFCDLRVAPDDADRVYVGGLRLIVSKDGGRTFAGEGGFAINKRRDTVFRLHPHRGVGMHLDVHDIWIDPEHPQRVLLGNDGGLFISHDRGETWLHLNNLPIAEFYRVHLDEQQPFRIWGGTQDNASFVGPSSARYRAGFDDDWEQVFLDPWSGGDGFSTFPDPNDPTVTYYTQQNGDMKRSTLGNLRAEKRIRPDARKLKSRQEGSDSKQRPELRFAWDTPFFASSHPGDTVLYCGAQFVMRSKDRGDSWEKISPDLGFGRIVCLVESPVDKQRLAAAGGRGRLSLTQDNGATWVAAGKGLPNKVVRDVVLSAHDPKRVFATLSGKPDHDCASYVYVSNDFGKTWASISKGLPAEPVNALAEDPQADGLLFIGTDLGVYTSINAGAEWESLCETLPTAPVVDVAVHGRDGVLVAATHGLSVFSLKIKPIRNAAKNKNVE